jgi:methylaspartate ammonia-lyase
VRYGLSQAILSAVAAARGLTMAEVIAEEWGLPLPAGSIPIHIETGHAGDHDLDQMIAHRVASLPHRLLDNASDRPGADAVFLTRRVRALAERIQSLGGPDYHPIIHIDAHGALGRISDENTGRILGHLYALENAARPYLLRVEDPAVMDSHTAQVDLMKRLMDYVQVRRMGVQIVAGAWACTVEDIRAFVEARAAHMIAISMPGMGSVHNSVDAVLACRAGGVGTLLGGNGVETGLAARVAVHVALATRPDLLAARPGVGVDEAIALVHNETARTLAWIQARRVGH